MIHHLLPMLFAMFTTKNGDTLFNLPVSMTFSKYDQWSGISSARKKNQRAKAQKRRMKR